MYYIVFKMCSFSVFLKVDMFERLTEEGISFNFMHAKNSRDRSDSLHLGVKLTGKDEILLVRWS
jgi:hypothetical protein